MKFVGLDANRVLVDEQIQAVENEGKVNACKGTVAEEAKLRARGSSRVSRDGLAEEQSLGNGRLSMISFNKSTDNRKMATQGMKNNLASYETYKAVRKRLEDMYVRA